MIAHEEISNELKPPICVGDVFVVASIPVQMIPACGDIMICIDIKADEAGNKIVTLLFHKGLRESFIPNKPTKGFWIKRVKCIMK